MKQNNLRKSAVLFSVALSTIGLLSCSNENQQKSSQSQSSTAMLFAKGEKITNDNFTGDVYLNNLISADSLNQNAVGSVTFEPGARTKWHTHPAGQIILAIDGVGYYQEKGKEKIVVRKGETVKCPADIPHWHGASVDTAFVQVAITGREKGETQWLDSVTDEEYNKAFKN